jgi:hypothetical protein
MPTFVIDPRDLGKNLTEEYGKMIDASVKAIQTTVALHGPRIAQAVVNSFARPPVDRGTYRRSFKAQKVAGGAVFYNSAPYASIIELGRRKGAKMPPIDVILAWVKRKRIGATLVGPVQPGRKVYSRLGARAKAPNARKLAVEARQRGIALMIARKISARGLPALHVLGITEEALTPIVEKAVDDALGRI